MPQLDALILGPKGNTHIAGSLEWAAAALGLRCRVEDTIPAYDGPSAARGLVWHLGGRRPYRLEAFSSRIEAMLEESPARQLITVGQAPMVARAIASLTAKGVRCVNYSTDDPWNPAHQATWHLDGLVRYNTIFTPRRSNVADFHALGCRDVRYLPFGYDPQLFTLQAGTPADATPGPEVLLVGGADKDRVEFVRAFMRIGPAPALVGGYWDRFSETRDLTLGFRSAAELCRLTARAAVNICLVRRANRDGHVMRSFEIPAVGGFMIAEDTGEHRELFGEEGDRVLFFRSPSDAAEKALWALARPRDRARMAEACHRALLAGRHTYTDRLQQMLETPV
jgi:spore maturation protein CgeB